MVESFVSAGCVHGEPLATDMLLALAAIPSKYTREDFEPGHFTASSVLVDTETRRLLLIRHPKLGRWLQPGGHIESADLSVAGAAAREAEEETGFVVRAEEAVGVGLEIHRIPAWGDEPSHLHLDLRFLFEVDEIAGASPSELDLEWFAVDSREARDALGETLDRVLGILDRSNPT